MARIGGVSPRKAGISTKMAYWFTRRSLIRLTGRAPERIIEPLEYYGHLPGLLRGYGRMEQAAAHLHGLPPRIDALAELKAATVVQCEYCIDMGSQIARRRGLSDDELLALPNYRTSSLFTTVDRLVLDYAVAMSRTPADVSDELFAELRHHFSEPQMVELTFVIALGNLRARFNAGLGVGAAGFSEGMVCAVPVSANE